jgi:steroid delta-isomerase-like uncharacterized protein
MPMVNEKMVKDWYAAWNSHDIDKILGFYSDDCLYEGVAAGTVTHGKQELGAYLKTVFTDYPNLKIEFKSTFYPENAACGEYLMSGTQAHSSNPAIPMTGKSYSVRGGYFSEWQNDKVKRHTTYSDYLTIMRQFGLAPSPPSRK